MSFYTEINPTNVNRAAFAAVIGSAALSIGLLVATSLVVSKVAAVALIVLGTLAFAVSAATTTAFFDKSSTSVEKYVENVGKHCMVTIPATIQFIATQVFNAVGRAIGDIVYNSIIRIFTGGTPSKSY